jgi:hypothetical protein
MKETVLMNFRINLFFPAVRIFAGLLVLVVVLFVSIKPVLAKGPESVTITGPGFEYRINLIDNENIDLEVKLLEQAGLWFGTAIPLTSEVPEGLLNPSYTLTWVNSGPPSMSVEERTILQEIYLDTKEEPIIHTLVQDSLKDWGAGMIGWFTAPEDLEYTLADLGMPDFQSPLILDAHLYKTAGDTVFPRRKSPGIEWQPRYVAVALVAGLVGLIGASVVKWRK